MFRNILNFVNASFVIVLLKSYPKFSVNRSQIIQNHYVTQSMVYRFHRELLICFNNKLFSNTGSS